MRLLWLWVLAGLLTAPGAPAESLAQVAQRERERRAKLKSEGLRGTPVVDEQALKDNQGRVANDPRAVPETEGSSPADAGPREAAAPRSAAAIAWPGEDVGASPRSEGDWRRLMAAARANLASMTKQYELLAGAHLGTGEYFVDPRTGENVIGGVARLQKLVAEAKQELDLARQQVEALQERARREHVPPGWLR